MIVLWAIVFGLVLLGGLVLNLFGLPGNWVNIVAAAVYAWCTPDEHRLSIGWGVVVAVLVLAIAGELLELVASALGVTRLGGSRRGAVFAVFGSLVGGLAGAVLGFPVPLIGPVIGMLLFAGFGALVGAVLGEWWKGRDWDTSLQIGRAAFWGRLLGTTGKLILGGAIVVVLAAAMALK